MGVSVVGGPSTYPNTVTVVGGPSSGSTVFSKGGVTGRIYATKDPSTTTTSSTYGNGAVSTVGNTGVGYVGSVFQQGSVGSVGVSTYPSTVSTYRNPSTTTTTYNPSTTTTTVTSPVTGKVYTTKLDQAGNIESVQLVGDNRPTTTAE